MTEHDDEDAQFQTMGETDPADVEYMFAQTAAGFSAGPDGRITLHGVAAATLWFSDRPYRLTGHLQTDEFVASWRDTARRPAYTGGDGDGGAG